MITESYYNEVIQSYPEYITKDQMYRICHISKRTCLFLLESGLVPNIDSGKKTRRFKIKTTDVIEYLKDRDDYPELYKAPDGFYKGNSDEINKELEKRVQHLNCFPNLFDKIDEAKFRKELDIEKCKQFVLWANIGFTNQLLSELRSTDIRT